MMQGVQKCDLSVPASGQQCPAQQLNLLHLREAWLWMLRTAI
jgi:hypothetical protein